MLKNEDAKQKILVDITRTDGRHLTGHLVLPLASDLVRSLNNGVNFLEFEHLDGTVQMIAKASIQDVASQSIAKAPSLKTADTTDPHAVLGIPRTASAAEARTAYLRLTKLYHPDQFTSVQLPDEVARYMSTMFSRSNTAYTLIKSRSDAETETV